MTDGPPERIALYGNNVRDFGLCLRADCPRTSPHVEYVRADLAREREGECERLRAELSCMTVSRDTHVMLCGQAASEKDTLRGCIKTLESQIGRLRKALEPFAELAAAYAKADEHTARNYRDEGHKYTPHPDSHRVSIALGSCRAARTALDGEGK